MFCGNCNVILRCWYYGVVFYIFYFRSCLLCKQQCNTNVICVVCIALILFVLFYSLFFRVQTRTMALKVSVRSRMSRWAVARSRFSSHTPQEITMERQWKTVNFPKSFSIRNPMWFGRGLKVPEFVFCEVLATMA